MRRANSIWSLFMLLFVFIKKVHSSLLPTLLFLFLTIKGGFVFSLDLNNPQKNLTRDSILTILETKQSEADRLKFLSYLIDDGLSDPLTDSTYLNELIVLNRKLELLDSTAYHLIQKGNSTWMAGNSNEALQYYYSAISHYDKIGFVAGLTSLLGTIRILFNQRSLHEERLRFHTQKLNYYQLNGPEFNSAACYHGIAGYYNFRGEFNTAINYYLKAAEIVKGISLEFYSNQMLVVGSMYRIWGNTDKSIEYLNEAIRLNEETRLNEHLASCYIELAFVYDDRSEFDEAMKYANKTNTTAEAIKSSEYIVRSWLAKADLFTNLNIPDSAIFYFNKVMATRESVSIPIANANGYFELDYFLGNYYWQKGEKLKAIDKFKIAYQKASLIQSNALMLQYLHALAAKYMELGNLSLSAATARDYIKLSDSVFNAYRPYRVAAYEQEIKDQEKMIEISKLKQDREVQEVKLERRKIIILVSFVSFIVMSVLIYIIYQQLQKNKKTLQQLKSTQNQLIEQEKLASLGQMTAGIAHEIQNPLNFIKNFSELSVDLIDELDAPGSEEEKKLLFEDIKSNLRKINEHSKRTDRIVKGMLDHSRLQGEEKSVTSVNELCKEISDLAWHGARARISDFVCEIVTSYDPNDPKVTIALQDTGRVILNLFNNAFYVLNQKRKADPQFHPCLTISTHVEGTKAIIRIRDNGTGISEKIQKDIFTPFFTTKPTGEGTGLGLSISYNIIKSQDGLLELEESSSQGTVFKITLPSS